MRSRLLVPFLLVAMIAAACGGSDDASESATDPGTPEESPDSDAGGVSGLDGGVGDFTAGDRGFRIVNLSDQAVDVYGFTDGLVEEYEIERGVEPDAITDYLAPPAEGRLVLFEAGATDVTEFGAPNLGEFSEDNFAEQGDRKTLVLSTDPETGEMEIFELWEDHDGSNPSGNALAAAATDGNGTVIMMTSTSSTSAADSFKPSEPGGTSCLSPRDPGAESIFIGGTQINAYDVAAPTFEFDLHSFDDGDLECEDKPALSGGSVDVGAGERVLAIIDQRSGSPEILVVPLG